MFPKNDYTERFRSCIPESYDLNETKANDDHIILMITFKNDFDTIIEFMHKCFNKNKRNFNMNIFI